MNSNTSKIGQTNDMSIKDMLESTPMGGHFLRILCNSVSGFYHKIKFCRCGNYENNCPNSYTLAFYSDLCITFHAKIQQYDDFIKLFWNFTLDEAYKILIEFNSADTHFTFALQCFKDEIELQKNKINHCCSKTYTPLSSVNGSLSDSTDDFTPENKKDDHSCQLSSCTKLCHENPVPYNTDERPKEKCSNCGCEILLFGDYFADYLMSKRYGKYYCKDCKPPCTFYFKTNLKEEPIEVVVPEDSISGMRMVYFFDLLANELQIDVNRIILWGLSKEQYLDAEKKSGKKRMICPGEYIEIDHRTFSVTIID